MKKMIILYLLSIAALPGCNNDKQDQSDVETKLLHEMLCSQQWIAKDTIIYVAAIDHDIPSVYYTVETHTLDFDDNTFSWEKVIKNVIGKDIEEEVMTEKGTYTLETNSINLLGKNENYPVTINKENNLIISKYMNSVECVVKLTFKGAIPIIE